MSFLMSSNFYILISAVSTYFKLEGVARAQSQVPGDSHPVPIRAPEHHSRGSWGTEAVVVFSLHAFIT